MTLAIRGRGDSSGGGFDYVTGTLNANGKAAGSATQQDAESGLLVPIGFSHQKSAMSTTLDKSTTPAVAFTQNQAGDVLSGGKCAAMGTNQNATGRNTPKINQGMQVRRLTPRECERLQGFPDDYTLVPHRGKPAADGPRYKAIGNSMAVPVMRWIGKRIEDVDGIVSE
jgi:DNA (cytosine-5)-methyltransferase 1